MPRKKTQAKASTSKVPTCSRRNIKPKVSGYASDNAEPAANTVSRKRKGKTVDAAVPPKKDKPVKRESDCGKPSTSTKEQDMKKIKFAGTIPIDEHCKEYQTGYYVLSEFVNALPPQHTTYNAMLNQTNIGENNNKYYILQLLKHNAKPEYVTWFRWGRVGKIAGTTLKQHGANLEAARTLFAKKFREKTGNTWWYINSSGFRKVKGKYDLLEMDYGKDEHEQAEKKIKMEAQVESKLDKRVKEVIDMIFDVEEFEACVKEMEFDIKKAPLGKLTTKQIKGGYETLKKIEKCIQKNFGDELQDACSEFYTRIPHDFGMKRPPLIRTPEQLKEKIQLLETLADIQIAIQIIEKDENKEEMSIIDRHYQSLGCKLEPLEKSHIEFKMVKKYVATSHGSTHRTLNLAVEDVYNITRDQDEKRFKKNIGNRMLLWHGSRLTNWCGILSQGLRIAPPEAPVSGYMFGKGVYFADMVSKSAGYCRASKRQPQGFLLLCEVALGQTNDKVHSDYHADKLPKGKSSTRGMGREVPDPNGQTSLSCGTVVPLGKPKTASDTTSRSLWYNEYIVYDVAQIKPRYLVKVKFSGPGLW